MSNKEYINPFSKGKTQALLIFTIVIYLLFLLAKMVDNGFLNNDYLKNVDLFRLRETIDGKLHEYLDNLSYWIIKIAQISIMLGFVIMVITQFYKKQYRPEFAKQIFCDWFKFNLISGEKGVTSIAITGNENDPNKDDPTLYRELLFLSQCGGEKTLFSLPIEHLCGQLNTAVANILQDPTNHPQLIAHLCGLDKNQLASTDQQIQMFKQVFTTDFTINTNTSSSKNDNESGSVSSTNSNPTPDEIDRKRAMGLTTIHHLIQRKIDGFQINYSFSWQSRLLSVSAIIALLFSFHLAVVLRVKGLNILGFTLLIALISTYTSMLWRDAVSYLVKLRK